MRDLKGAIDSIVYLDWYFGEDNGGADKEAVKAYEELRRFALCCIIDWKEIVERRKEFVRDNPIFQKKEGKEYAGDQEIQKETCRDRGLSDGQGN